MIKIPEHSCASSRPKWAAVSAARFRSTPTSLTCFCLDGAEPAGQVDRDPHRELQVATIHGRDHIQYVELCGTKDGTITGSAPHRGVRRHGRLPLDGRARRPDHPARPDAIRALHHSERRRTSTGSTPTRRRWTRTAAPAALRRPTCSNASSTCIRARIKMDPAEVRKNNLIPSPTSSPTRRHRAELRLRQLPGRAGEG